MPKHRGIRGSEHSIVSDIVVRAKRHVCKLMASSFFHMWRTIMISDTASRNCRINAVALWVTTSRARRRILTEGKHKFCLYCNLNPRGASTIFHCRAIHWDTNVSAHNVNASSNARECACTARSKSRIGACLSCKSAFPNIATASPVERCAVSFGAQLSSFFHGLHRRMINSAVIQRKSNFF